MGISNKVKSKCHFFCLEYSLNCPIKPYAFVYTIKALFQRVFNIHTGSGSDPIQVKALSLSPNPIVIPGNVNVSVDAVITETIDAPSSLKLEVKKKLFGVFISVPCVDNVGSWYVVY